MKNILIVEDETFIGAMLKEHLSMRGYHIFGPYRRSGEALGALQNKRVDFACVDFRLHGDETSLPVARELEAHGIPYVFISGNLSSDQYEFEMLSPLAVFGKPIPMEELLNVIETHRYQSHATESSLPPMGAQKRAFNPDALALLVPRFGDHAALAVEEQMQNDLRPRLTELETLLAADDVTKTRLELHSLAGLCGVLGLNKLQDVLKGISRKTLPMTAGDAQRLCQDIDLIFAASSADVQRYISNKKINLT